MTSRARLPNRRAASTFNFEVGGLRYTATVGRFHDGRIGELFLQNHKSDNSADTNARDAAIAFSFAVQHGADPTIGETADRCRVSQPADFKVERQRRSAVAQALAGHGRAFRFEAAASTANTVATSFGDTPNFFAACNSTIWLSSATTIVLIASRIAFT